MNFAAWLFPQRVVDALGWTLLHSLWQGALASLGLAAALFFLRRSSARTRYAIGLFALVLVLAVSVMTFWNQFAAGAPAAATAAAGPSLLSVPAGSAGGPTVLAGAARGLGERIAAFFGGYFVRHLPLLVTLWLLGVLVMSLRFAGAMIHVQRLKFGQTRPLPAPWPDRVEALAVRAGLRRPLAALESLRLRTPMVIGHFKPLLLLPVGLVTGMSAGEVEALLAHELAHVRRRDYLVNVLQNLLDILYFFHPGVRWISACVRQEREHCCDDVAVELCGDPRDYARALASLPLHGAGQAQPAVAAVGRPQRLLQRIVRLLGRPRRIPEFREGFISALLLVCGLLAMLKLAAAGGVPAEARPGRAGEPQAAASEKFASYAFDLEQDGLVGLSGTVPAGWSEQPGTWIISDDDGGLAWLKFLAVDAGKPVSFSEEVPLKAGAYRWYVPSGSSAAARLGNDAARTGLLLRREQEELLIERHRGADGKLPPLRAELMGQLAALLAEERSRKEVSASQRLREEEERQHLLQLALEQKRMKEEEKNRLEHERQALAAEELRLKGERPLLEQELRAREDAVKAKSAEEEAKLKAEQARLLEEQRLAAAELALAQRQHQDQADRARAELERLKVEEMELQARQQVEAMAAKLEVHRAKEELMRREVERMKAEEARLRAEVANFKALVAELDAAGLIDQASPYKVELSNKALVVNGARQPAAVHERIKKFYEQRFAKKLPADEPVTIKNAN